MSFENIFAFLAVAALEAIFFVQNQPICAIMLEGIMMNIFVK